jgi:hypothetical protein
MKKIILIINLIFVGLLFNSCTKNFNDFNTDKKNPASVKGEFLFSYGQKQLMDQISSTNVNLNVWKLFAQYWTETTYTDEANYDIVNRTIADLAFRTYYRNVLNSFKQASMLIQEDVLAGGETEGTRTNKLLIIDVLEVYCYANLVDIFGNVPYSEALNIDNPNPKYDDAASIYADLFTRLDKDISSFTPADGSFANADVIYDGDVAAWKTFANSLKLKLAIHLADVDPGTAKANAEAAVTAGVFTSAADNAMFAYMGSVPNTNPLNVDLVQSGRSDFVVANTLVDMMNTLEDPRRDVYFSNQIGGEWVGGVYGASNAFTSYSHINDAIEAPDFPGILMTYSEIEFYIAEAAARGYSVGQTAEEAYNAAITASFEFWGLSSADADAYLAKPEVAYSTAGDSWQEVIGTQSYIAFYTRGFIGYTQYRRLDYPMMNEAPNAVTGGPVPTRFTYPVNEQTLNAASYAEASSAIGGDDLLTKLFWDKH